MPLTVQEGSDTHTRGRPPGPAMESVSAGSNSHPFLSASEPSSSSSDCRASGLVHLGFDARNMTGEGDSQQVLLAVSGKRHRTESASSAVSNDSRLSAFSNETAERNADMQKERDVIAQKRAEQQELFPQIEEEVRKMLKACENQRNVSMTIKLGLRAVEELVDKAKFIHKEVDKLEVEYTTHLKWDEEARADRRKIRERVQANLIRETVLSCSQKRGRTADSPDKKLAKKAKKKGQAGARSSSEIPHIVVTPSDSQQKTKIANGESDKSQAKKKEKKRSAVLVKVKAGQTYAAVLGKIRNEIDWQASNTTVLSAIQTKAGNVLLKLARESDREAFAGSLSKVVEGIGSVDIEGPVDILEILDMDCLTDTDEVKEALQRQLGNTDMVRKIRVLGPNSRGQKLAILEIQQVDADKLLKAGHIRIGMMSCRVRKRAQVIRCYRCLEFGHKRQECQGVDRSSVCHNCGKAGHVRAECKEKASCFLCSEDGNTEHVAGSGECPTFRRALEHVKKVRNK